MALKVRRIEFLLSDPELRVLCEFAHRNNGAQTRPENFSTAVIALQERGWPNDDAKELVRSFAKQLDIVNAKIHAAAHSG